MINKPKYNLVRTRYNIESIEYLIDNSVYVSWFNISYYQKLTEDFIEKYNDKVVWDIIIRRQLLSYDFMEKHLYKYSLYNINAGTNIDKIIKLQNKYKYKYYIDKLQYELSK